MRRQICLLGIGLALLVPIGCDNPESREAGEKIGDAATATGSAIEASAEEGVEQTGAALEDLGGRMQDSVQTPEP